MAQDHSLLGQAENFSASLCDFVQHLIFGMNIWNNIHFMAQGHSFLGQAENFSASCILLPI